MSQYNHLEERHLSSLDDLQGVDLLEVTEDVRGGVGLGFDEITPLSVFDEAWDGLELEPEMLSGSLRFDLAVSWRSVPPLPNFTGQYRIPAPMDILGQDSRRLADMLPDGVQREFAMHIRQFDRSLGAEEGDFTTYLHINPAGPSHEVWFHNLVALEEAPHPAGFVKLELSFHEYEEMLLLAKGLMGWQYLFADVSFKNSVISHFADGLRNGLDAFPDLFPDQDFSPLVRRLEARL
ncbi:hypothetical protein [Streptomyces sp. SD31]|uniref:hypothetical protein n=1 Tax=Streptomyces sp. SD31 TaxID=3452208 RepID=UPI003F8BA015